MVYRKFLSTSLLVGGLFMATVANAQNINSLETRLNRLENDMQTMSRAMFRGDVPPPQYAAPQDSSAAAAMEVRIGQIEEQLQRLTGRMEETQYQLRQMEERLQEFSAQAASRANNANNVSGNTSSPYVNDYNDNADTDVSSNGNASEEPYQLGTLNAGSATPAALYDEAFAYLQRNDYQAAENAFRDFTTRYPDHSLVSNAKYWLGETFYARGDYTGASRAFARAFQDHSDSQKAPDMLLKLGMSLAKQDKKDEACLTLAELKKRYPTGPASVMQTADDERRTLGCDS